MMISLMIFSLIFPLLMKEGHGQYQEINVAALENDATCVTSSAYDSYSGCTYAMDFMETPDSSEWVTERDGMGHFITITPRMPALVSTIKLLQRCFSPDMVREVRVGFSDSSSQTLTLSCDGGGQGSTDCGGITWETFTLSPVTTSFINITITNVCSQSGFNGFREIVVLGTEQTRLNLALGENGGTCLASSEWSANYLCNNVFDQALTGYQQDCWYTIDGQNVGAWIKITLPRLSTVTMIRILGLCYLEEQMANVRIDFDGGVSMNVGLTCFDGSVGNYCPERPWDQLAIPAITTTSVLITGTVPCSESPETMAFQEVEVYGTPYTSESGCPFNFTAGSDLNSCYRFVHQVQDMRNVTEAKAACAAFYSDARLVEIKSYEEHQYLEDEAEQNRINGATCSDYYVGGRRLSHGAFDWYWDSNFELIPVSERYWGPGEPADTGLYMSFRYYPGSHPGERWQWAALSGIQSVCYICESDPLFRRATSGK